MKLRYLSLTAALFASLFTACDDSGANATSSIASYDTLPKFCDEGDTVKHSSTGILFYCKSGDWFEVGAAIPTAKSSSSAAVIRSSSSNALGFEAPAAPAGFKAKLQGNTLQVNVIKSGDVNVQVFNMMGNVIDSHTEHMAAGSFAHKFTSMPQGMYVIRVQQGSAVKIMKMQVK